MADFCNECFKIVWGEDVPLEKRDMYGLCQKGEIVQVLCEGCGIIYVDHEGNRFDKTI